MPINFRILPRHNLLFLDCVGHVTPEENYEVLERYLAHPDRDSSHRHLVDLSRFTGYGRHPADLMALHARLAQTMPHGPQELVMAYYAPTPVAMWTAQMVQRAWDDIPFTRIIAHPDEAEILVMLGLPATTIRDLLLCAG